MPMLTAFRRTRGAVPAAFPLSLLLLAPVVPARADVVGRTLAVDVEYAQRYGTAQGVRTSADARIRLFTEIAAECPRLEAMSGLGCRVESLTLHSDEQPGRTALLASVRFVLGPKGEKPPRRPRRDEFRFDRKPGGLF